MYTQNKIALTAIAFAILILLAVVWLTPVAFSAFLVDDMFTGFWYYISQSGGVYGTGFLVLFVALIVAGSRVTFRQRVVAFLIALVVINLTLGAFAFFNEYGLKRMVKAPRPSLKYLTQNGINESGVVQFYKMEKDERRAYLKQQVAKHKEKVKHIAPDILYHWIDESGYSFPSGHTQNAFMLGVITTLILSGMFAGTSRIWVSLIPITWSVLVGVSRVAIGVHTKVDVTAGALMGTTIALLISYVVWKKDLLHLQKRAGNNNQT